MPPSLVSDPTLLDDYPGAPFPAFVVESAAESVRSDAGWHIAPQVTETVTVDGAWSKLLILPTLKLVSVSAVRVWNSTTEVYEARTGWRLAGSGMLWHPLGWDYGVSGVEVDMVHGFDDCPLDLIPVVAARCQRASVDATVTQRSETVGARTSSEAYNINRLEIEAGASGVDKYKLRRLA